MPAKAVISNATLADDAPDVQETLQRAEETGLQLAIIARTAALVLLGVWLVGSRADDSVRMFNYLSALLLFAVLGLVHYALIGTRFDRPWIKYLFVTLDIAIVSALMATQPIYRSAAELPAVFIFRLPFNRVNPIHFEGS
jgi:hypothetical protein